MATEEDISQKLLSLHAESILEKYFVNLTQDTVLRGNLPTTPEDSTNPELPPIGRVAVIGGGVSGLRVAMKLGKAHKVDVYEATDRVGGRLFTYKFDGGGEYDYFDVGAMRFPKTKVMDPTFGLFDEIGIKTLEYHMQTKESWRLYNNIRKTYGEVKGTKFDFDARISKGGNVPNKWADIGSDDLMNIVFKRFLDDLKKDHVHAYPRLLEYDNHSTRSFMAFVKLDEVKDPDSGKVLYPKKDLYPAEVINWLETMNFSVGWFDRAFVETVLELLAFADGDENVKWRCVDHGSDVITTTMKKRMEDDPNQEYEGRVQIKTRHQTIAVTYDPSCNEPLTVSGKYQPDPKVQKFEDFRRTGYSHVVLAVSPQCMRYIDLSTCKLDYAQRSAVLMLQPGPSTKVGIKFKTHWWNIPGGQSTTDRTVRTVVYPSHGGKTSTVLIASYCWTQDAATMGALMQGEESGDTERLKANILKDLAEIHGLELSFILDQFEDWFPFDWAHNPKTMGAYAFFGPSQFSSLFKNLSRPAANHRLHFAGEAISTCHAWVAGALESADRVVNMMYPVTGKSDGVDPIPHGGDDGEPEPTKDTTVLFGSKYILRQLFISEYLQNLEK